MFVRFFDMHSGGYCKYKPFEMIYVEADTTAEACRIFKETVGRDPDGCACECCGADYSYGEPEELDQATGYYRHCRFDAGKWVEIPDIGYSSVITIEDYLAQPEVLVIYKDDDDSNLRFKDDGTMRKDTKVTIHLTADEVKDPTQDSLETLIRVFFDWKLALVTATTTDEFNIASAEIRKIGDELKRRTNWYESRGVLSDC